MNSLTSQPQVLFKGDVWTKREKHSAVEYITQSLHTPSLANMY